MRRREWLGMVGAAALVGCGEDPAERTEPPVEPEPIAPEPEAPEPEAPEAEAPEPEATPATDADWARLAEQLEGDLVRPDHDGYAQAKRLFDPRFDALTPQGVAYARSESDVQRLIAFARAHGVPFTARCGGHSYAGYSSGPGLVCDVGPMAEVTIDGDRATIGAGAKLIDIYAALAPRRLVIPGGTCPSVGVSGLTLGGGQGVFGRALGLTCDEVRSLRLVTADGTLHACDAETDADLFWASRGGGGGNYGVVTRFVFETSSVPEVTRFALPFRWDAAADVVAAWQRWAPDAAPELWTKVELGARGDSRSVAIHGVLLGSEDRLGPLLDAFEREAGTRPRRRRVESAPLLETMLVLGGCARRTYEECHLPPEGTLGRGLHLTRSDVFDAPLPDAGLAELLEALDRAGLEEGSGRVGLDSLGGAIADVAPDATAFVHRRARFIAQYATYWGRRAGPEIAAASERWLDGLYRAGHAHAAGAYANYIDPDLEGWAEAYYGANLARLRAIKARHDPRGFFDFAQAIRP